MEPGQYALQLGTWLGVHSGTVEGQLGGRGDVFLSHSVGLSAMSGLQRASDGSIQARDSVLAVTWLPVSKADLVVRLSPGINIPTGGLGQALLFTPLSTSSFDPWMSGDIVFGGAWVGAVSGVVRVPLYPGWDLRRQGPFARLDLRGARRLTGWVPSVGVSVARQAPSVPVGAAPDFADVAGTAGVVVNLGERWSAAGQLRIPVWVSEASTWIPAGGFSIRAVLGNPPDDHEH